MIPVVREFYYNATQREGYQVFVQGKMVLFDSKTINAYYQLPNLEDDYYTTYWEEELDLDQFITALCRPWVEWKLNNEEVVTFLMKEFDWSRKCG